MFSIFQTHINYCIIKNFSNTNSIKCKSKYIKSITGMIGPVIEQNYSTIDSVSYMEDKTQKDIERKFILDTKKINNMSHPYMDKVAKICLKSRHLNVLAPPESPEDLDIIKPQVKPTYNLAAYVDRSDVLKQFIGLGVEIAEWDKDTELCSKILTLNFEKDIKPYIFALHDFGVATDGLGYFFKANPYVLFEKLENLIVRVNYLESKKMSKENIAKILTAYPKWISENTVKIDKELGYFQKRFRLRGHEVRQLIVKDPKLIVYSSNHYFAIERATLMILDEFGFTIEQARKMLLDVPRVFRTDLRSLARRFDIAHSEMGLPHEMICDFPVLFTVKARVLRERHGFLKYIKRNQYNPEKTNYVCPLKFALDSDADFSINVAGVEPQMFDDYMKTM